MLDQEKFGNIIHNIQIDDDDIVKKILLDTFVLNMWKMINL